jgi:membrane protein DedA with SNARE-associated domain
MSLIAKSLGYVGNLAVSVISSLGYAGVFVLMFLESTAVPIPAELVMPFAGFLAASGRFSLLLVILVAGLGSLAGSLLSYAVGRYGGIALIRRYGKYVLLDERDLKETQGWFSRRGEKTILFGRLIPVVRHLISIPAGVGKMELKRFCLYTFVGATLWNGFLAYLGYVLGQNWEMVRQYTEPFSYAVAILLLAGVIWFVCRHVKRRGR